VFIPDVLADETRTTTDDDGSFSLRGLPSQGVIQLKIAAAGFASPWASCNLQKTVTIQLARSGGLRGTLLGMQEAQATGAITLFLSPDPGRQRLLPGDAAADDTTVTAFFSTTIETTADGTFECNEVPAGKYVLRLRSDANKPGEPWRFYAEDCPPFEVRPNELTSVSLQLRPAIAVRGKVIDKKTKAGVPNVRVSLYVTSGAPGSPGSSVSATTDAQGEFVAYTRPGKARISIYDLPGNYIQDAQRGSAAQSQEISGPTELPAIEVVEAAGVEGIVVDESGEPVADAEIYCLDDSHVGLREPIRSDARGRFSLAKLSPSATLPVKARTADSVAEQTVVKPSEIQEPLRLVVSKKNAFAIRGQVVDESGQPIGGAEATLASTWWIGGTGWGMSLGKCNSDGQGRFEFTGLWAGDRYQVKIAKEGFGQYETPNLRGEAGRPHDLAYHRLAGRAGDRRGPRHRLGRQAVGRRSRLQLRRRPPTGQHANGRVGPVPVGEPVPGSGMGVRREAGVPVYGHSHANRSPGRNAAHVAHR
jgi:hypothetical protein